MFTRNWPEWSPASGQRAHRELSSLIARAAPPDTRNDIRSMDADGAPRAETARRLRVSRNTVASGGKAREPPAPGASQGAPRSTRRRAGKREAGDRRID